MEEKERPQTKTKIRRPLLFPRGTSEPGLGASLGFGSCCGLFTLARTLGCFNYKKDDKQANRPPGNETSRDQGEGGLGLSYELVLEAAVSWETICIAEHINFVSLEYRPPCPSPCHPALQPWWGSHPHHLLRAGGLLCPGPPSPGQSAGGWCWAGPGCAHRHPQPLGLQLQPWQSQFRASQSACLENDCSLGMSGRGLCCPF